MTGARARFHAGLTEALREYLAGAGESALERAYEAGRGALQDGLGVLDAVAVHRAVLLAQLQAAGDPAETIARAEKVTAVCRESLTSFEMAQRGYREANGTLRALNVTLEDRARQLAAAHAAVEADRLTIAQQRDALLRAHQQREQLTAFVVHDLKNPLSGIVLNATLLARDPGLSADQKDTARTVLRTAQSMNRMVLNLLDISRSEDGALVPRREALDLAALVADIAASMRTRVGAGRQQIVASVALADPVIVGDVDLLRRVLENLLDNALRYSPREGTVTLDVRAAGDAAVEIRVRDEGSGVPPADRERVFDKYVQLDAPEGRDVRAGRGLGLVFCRLAVEAHGGTIWVEEGAPCGAVFCVRLPCAREDTAR